MLTDALTRDSTLGIKSIGFTCRLLFDEAQVENAVDAPAESKDAEKGASQFSQFAGDAKLRGDSSPNKPITFGSRFFRYSFKDANSQGSVANSTILAAILKGHLSIGFQASAKIAGAFRRTKGR